MIWIKILLAFFGIMFLSTFIVLGFNTLFGLSTDIDDVSGYISILTFILIFVAYYLVEKHEKLKQLEEK